MMDKNSYIGILAIVAILAAFMYINRPSKAELAKQKAHQDSVAAVQAKKDSVKAIAVNKKDSTLNNAQAHLSKTDSLKNDSTQKAALANDYGVFANNTKGKEKHFTIENDLMKVTLTTLGGRISSVQLKKYHTYYKKPLFLFKEDSSIFNLNFFTKNNRNIYTSKLYFAPLGNDIKVSGKDSATFKMRLYVDSSKSSYIEYVYTIKGNSYMMDYHINFVGMNKVISPRERFVFLNWEMTTPSQEKTLRPQRRYSSVYYKYNNESPDNLSRMKDEKQKLEATTKWVAFRQQFFSTILISDNFFGKTDGYFQTHTPKDSDYVKTMTARLAIPFSGKKSETNGMRFYFGPNKYQTMEHYGMGLEQVVLTGIGGWGIFRWINEWVVIPLFDYLGSFNMNYGIIILLLTLIIKLALSPITYKNFISQAKMRVLKPEIDELGVKFKGDAMKKQQATMALYKQVGVSPLSGCLPMLLQTPILVALYEYFPFSIELRQQPFLWADDLSTYDSIYHLPFNIPFYGDHISLFTLLMAVAMFGYMKINGQMTSAGGGSGAMANQMKIMVYIMPFFMLFFFNSYSAGLSYYYFLSNMFSMGQALVIQKWVIDEDEIHKQLQANKVKNKGKVKKSKFQQRLEAAQAKQKEIEARRKKR